MSKLVESVLRLFHTDNDHGRKRSADSKRHAVKHRARRTRKERSVLAADSFIFVAPEEDRGKPYVLRGRANTCADELLSSSPSIANAQQRSSKLFFRNRRSGGSRVSDEGSSRASLSSGRAVSFQEPLNVAVEPDDPSPSVPLPIRTQNMVYEIRFESGDKYCRLLRPKSLQTDLYSSPYEPSTSRHLPSPAPPPVPTRMVRREDSDLCYLPSDHYGMSSSAIFVCAGLCVYGRCMMNVR